MAKNGHNTKAIAHAKYSLGLKNYKCKKGGKNDCATTLELLCEKNGSKKQLILEK